jgi:hypothetical protein
MASDFIGNALRFLEREFGNPGAIEKCHSSPQTIPEISIIPNALFPDDASRHPGFYI